MGACAVADAGTTYAAAKPTRNTMGDRRTVFLDVALSSSYASGGDSLDLSPFFKVGVDFVDIEAVTIGGTVFRPEFVRGASPSASKLKAYSGAGQNSEVTGDQHLTIFRVMAVGK